MTSSGHSYCVVGGGISGLTAAYRLRRLAGADASITLFEPSERLGGVLRTEVVGGVAVDVGAEAFVVRRPEMPALLAELDLANEQLGTTGARPLVYSQARLHPLPAGTLNGIPSSSESMAGLVNDATLARIANEPQRALSWQPGADPAVADLIADRFGEQVVARSVDPMLSGVYAGSSATIGLRSAAPTLAAGLDAGATSVTEAVRQALTSVTAGPIFGAVGGGYTVLVDELVRRTGFRRVQTAVDGVDATGSGWVVRDATGSQWPADAVILAVPPVQLARLVADVAPRTAAAAARITSASSAVLAMAVPRGIAFPQNSGVLVASGEQLHAKAITLTSRKWGRRTDVELLRLSFGRFGDDLATATSDDQLLAWALEDIGTVFDLAVEPVDVRLQRWPGAMPQYGPGHRDVVAELRAGLPPTCQVAGSFLDGIGVPACVGAAGRAAAAAVRAVETPVAR